MNAEPPADRCGRCRQTRPCFDAKPTWGDVPARVCSPCWSRYADARAAKTFVDAKDAFNNASDEEPVAGLGLGS
jgi:hypothetical protein